MYRSSPFRSTMNTNVITALGMRKVCTEAVHSDSTMNTNVITALGMRKVCTEAVHSVALWTLITALGMCKVCTEAIHSVARKRQDRTCESTCEHENAKTRKRENGRNQPVDAKTAKTRKRRKRRKQENRENGENAKTAKTRKRENGENEENGQKCSCFLVFNFSFSGFLGFLGFLVFSFSGFLVPLAAPFWPGRVFYVLRLWAALDFSTKFATKPWPHFQCSLPRTPNHAESRCQTCSDVPLPAQRRKDTNKKNNKSVHTGSSDSINAHSITGNPFWHESQDFINFVRSLQDSSREILDSWESWTCASFVPFILGNLGSSLREGDTGVHINIYIYIFIYIYIRK